MNELFKPELLKPELLKPRKLLRTGEEVEITALECVWRFNNIRLHSEVEY